MSGTHIPRQTKVLFTLCTLFFLIACGTLQVEVEHTPTPDQAATATVAALVTENTRLATQVATLTTPDQAATATVAALVTENARLATQVATLTTSTPAPPSKLGKVAYVQGGDIWVKDLTDGEPQRLTTDGRNKTPRWSPSGEWIAFRKGEYGQVWLMRADGSDARSLETPPDAAFAWSPMTDRLAYADINRLQVIQPDGSEVLTLVSGPQVNPPTPPPPEEQRIGRIAWSPDGNWLAYEWWKQQANQPTIYQGLWKISANGEQSTELYISGVPTKGEAILAGWYPDGQYILFWQGDILSASMLADGVPLYSLPAGGGEPLQLVDAVLVHDDFLSLAPQGNRLAVTAGGYRATWTNKRIAVVEAGDGELTWLTDESVAAFSPTWSPDSKRLAYVSMPDRGDLVGGDTARLGMMERHIWLMNADGSGQRQLTNDPDYRDERPLWSADGNHLLIARMDTEGRASLWLMSAEGGDPSYQVVEELTPLPGPASGWFGYYGYVDWDQLFDWWQS